MGEYAELSLAAAMRRGTPAKPFTPKPGARVRCSLCPREIGGGFQGMVDHTKSSHGMKDAEARQHVLALRTKEPSRG